MDLCRSRLALLAKPPFLWDKRERGAEGSSSRWFGTHRGNKLSFSTYTCELLCDRSAGNPGTETLLSELPGVSCAAWSALSCRDCWLGVPSALNVRQKVENQLKWQRPLEWRGPAHRGAGARGPAGVTSECHCVEPLGLHLEGSREPLGDISAGERPGLRWELLLGQAGRRGWRLVAGRGASLGRQTKATWNGQLGWVQATEPGSGGSVFVAVALGPWLRTLNLSFSCPLGGT